MEDPHCDCSGMMSREHALGNHETSSWFYQNSIPYNWSYCNFAYSPGPPGHVVVITGHYGDICYISNCGTPCYNAEKTEYEVEYYYAQYPRHF